MWVNASLLRHLGAFFFSEALYLKYLMSHPALISYKNVPYLNAKCTLLIMGSSDFYHLSFQVNGLSSMALTEDSTDLLPLNNGGVPQNMSASTPSEPAGRVAESAPELNENTEQKARTSKTEPACQTSVRQNCSPQPSSPSASASSAFLSQFSPPKLLPTSLPHHPSACCPFQEPECCNGNQQEGNLFQGPLHSRRALHMGPCCVQGAPSFCMQQQWQERFQNQPNMNTFR